MRKFRFIYVLMAASFFVACAESDDLYENETNPVAKNPYEISIETAMQTLETMFPEMMRTTRVSASEVKTLRRSDLGMTTRSEDEDPQAPVAYIIPLANNGCAIMGADTRKERLYAALESTTLTPDDIARAVQQQQSTRAENTNGSEGADGEFEQINDIKEFASGLIANSIRDGIQFPPQDSFPNGVIDEPTRLEIVATDTVKQLLNTKWFQDYPFNKYQGLHPRTGDTLKAGCGPIALAQVIYYHKHPQTYDNYTFYWDLLMPLEVPFPNMEVYESNSNEGAILTYKTRKMLNIPHDTTTTSNISDLMNAMRIIGYENVAQRNGWSSTIIRDEITDSCCVFLFGSHKINNEEEGHIWLADGFKVFEYKYYSSPNVIFLLENKTLFHYNFGWGGNCDGYYLPAAVDLRDSLDEKFVDPSFGDIIYKQDNLYYNRNFRAIIYDIPNEN